MKLNDFIKNDRIPETEEHKKEDQSSSVISDPSKPKETIEEDIEPFHEPISVKREAKRPVITDETVNFDDEEFLPSESLDEMFMSSVSRESVIKTEGFENDGFGKASSKRNEEDILIDNLFAQAEVRANRSSSNTMRIDSEEDSDYENQILERRKQEAKRLAEKKAHEETEAKRKAEEEARKRELIEKQKQIKLEEARKREAARVAEEAKTAEIARKKAEEEARYHAEMQARYEAEERARQQQIQKSIQRSSISANQNNGTNQRPVQKPNQAPVSKQQPQKKVSSQKPVSNTVSNENSTESKIEILFKKSGTDIKYKEKWIATYEKAVATPEKKRNYVINKCIRGRFTIRDDKIEMLPEMDVSGKSSSDMLKMEWKLS